MRAAKCEDTKFTLSILGSDENPCWGVEIKTNSITCYSTGKAAFCLTKKHFPPLKFNGFFMGYRAGKIIFHLKMNILNYIKGLFSRKGTDCVPYRSSFGVLCWTTMLQKQGISSLPNSFWLPDWKNLHVGSGSLQLDVPPRFTWPSINTTLYPFELKFCWQRKTQQGLKA